MAERRFSMDVMEKEWGMRPLAELQELARGFLVQVSQTQPPTGPMKTADDWTSPTTLEMETWVLPVSRAPGSGHAFISIGRIDGNDVVLADVTVSKFHAVVREVDGCQFLLDGDSHNGTFLNDQRVPSRKGGTPMPLRHGDSVRFGSVQTSYVDAFGLQALLTRLR